MHGVSAADDFHVLRFLIDGQSKVAIVAFSPLARASAPDDPYCPRSQDPGESDQRTWPVDEGTARARSLGDHSVVRRLTGDVPTHCKLKTDSACRQSIW